MREFIVLLFAIAAGLTLSGIVANLYRLLVGSSGAGGLVYCAVMVFAGPSILFENATRSFRGKASSILAYAFAVAVAGYWSFALGLFLLDLYLAL